MATLNLVVDTNNVEELRNALKTLNQEVAAIDAIEEEELEILEMEFEGLAKLYLSKSFKGEETYMFAEGERSPICKKLLKVAAELAVIYPSNKNLVWINKTVEKNGNVDTEVARNYAEKIFSSEVYNAYRTLFNKCPYTVEDKPKY